jgi:hypothetical protein
MLDRVLDHCLESPRRMISLGQTLSSVGSICLLAAMLGHLMTTAPGIALTFGQKAALAPTLKTLLPDLPTWWVSESILGCVPAALLIVLGIWLVMTGKRFVRLNRAL